MAEKIPGTVEGVDEPINFEDFVGMDLNNRFGDHRIIGVELLGDEFLQIKIDLGGRENVITAKKTEIKRDGDGFIVHANIAYFRINPRK